MQIAIRPGDQNKSIATGYAFAVLAALAGLLLRETLSPFLGLHNPYHAAWAAVAFSAWYYGAGPAILTAFISVFGVWYWFLPPYHSFALQDPKTEFPGMIGFLVLSGLIALLGEINLRAKARLQQEIAERKRAEAALQDSEARFRAFFEQATIGIASFNIDGRFVDANRKFCDLLGYPLEQVLQMTIAQVTHPDYIAADAEHLRQLKAGYASQYSVEKRYVRGDGSFVWVAATVFPIHGDDGNIQGFAKVIEDISIRKQAEMELARERNALESRVEERTQQLNNTIKQLNIQAAERARAELSLSNLSARLLQLQDEERRRIARELHDSAGQTMAALDMQLSIIQMRTQNLNGDLAAAVADSISLVQEASRGIRTMSYLLHPPLLDESGLASPLQWFVEGFSQRSGIQVELRISQGFGRLPREMELTFFRIVQEALTNVHRHSGSPTAQVELNRSGTEVTLLIRDQGKGISKSEQDHSSREPSRIGVGIRGMRERVHQLGGTIKILAGEPGTILQVILPLQLIREVETSQYSEAAALTTLLPGIGKFGRD